MRKLVLAWTVVALLMPLPLEAAPGPAYLPPEADDFRAILADPPAKGSEETRREIEIVLREQSRRTAADVARIQAEATRMVVAFAEVLGPKLTARDLPLTFALIRDVGNDTGERIEESKRVWNRSRHRSQSWCWSGRTMQSRSSRTGQDRRCPTRSRRSLSTGKI